MRAGRAISAAALAVLVAATGAATAAGGHRPPTGVVNVSRTPDLAEGEETVAVNPRDPDNIIVGSNQFQPFQDADPSLPVGGSGITQCAVWSTHDGGRHWEGGLLGRAGIGRAPNPAGAVTGPPSEFGDLGNLISADQNTVFDRHGRAFYQCIYSGVRVGDVQVWVFRSDDGGAHWSEPVTAFSEENTLIQIDRPYLAVDDSGGPRDGTLYLTWETMFYQGWVPQVYVRASHDGGRTWGPVVRVDDDAHEAMWDPRQYPVVGADGALYIGYDSAPLVTPVPGDPNASDITLMLARSTDGGKTFTRHVVERHAFRNSDDDEAEPGFSELISALATDPRRPGHLAVAWPDARTGASKILLRTSVDGGAHWSRAGRVTDLPADRVDEDHVALAYLPDGRVAVAWRDRRRSDGAFGDPFDVWARAFTPAGRPHPAGRLARLTARPQRPTTGHRGEMPSEYIGLAAGPEGLTASWDELRGRYPDNVMRRIPLAALR